MVTNYPQQLAAAAEVERTGSRTMHRIMTRLGQLLCGLGGHDSVLHFEGSRVMMRCTSCGHDTPGWEVSGRGPRRRFDGDPRRHTLKKPRLVLHKTA
jgi:NAD-dependent SIR2 family protein deacetylase